jgi:transposase-like protein
VDGVGQEKCILRVEKINPASQTKAGQKQDAHVKENTIIGLNTQASMTCKGALDELLRSGAQQMLQQAIQNEVAEYLQAHTEHRDQDHRRLVVGNGRLPERSLLTPAGAVKIQQPRVRDRRPGHKFVSQILPPYLRRTPSLDALIPALYLRGISSGDFSEALASILGEQAAGLSATNIVRLKEGWQGDYTLWQQRDLSGQHYVYWWADGIHFNVRLSDDRPCVLVIMGALANGAKELVAVAQGQRESKLSWLEVMRDLKKRGLQQAPELAVGDGALGFWAAKEEEFPKTREQRCWVHKTANVLDKLPKSVQPMAKNQIHEMYLAPTRAKALLAYDQFLKDYTVKYPQACECLKKDQEVLFAFYDFPAEHWAHLRTTNPIESTFATARAKPRAADRRPPLWRWCFNSFESRKNTGVVSTDLTYWLR